MSLPYEFNVSTACDIRLGAALRECGMEDTVIEVNNDAIQETLYRLGTPQSDTPIEFIAGLTSDFDHGKIAVGTSRVRQEDNVIEVRTAVIYDGKMGMMQPISQPDIQGTAIHELQHASDQLTPHHPAHRAERSIKRKESAAYYILNLLGIAAVCGLGAKASASMLNGDAVHFGAAASAASVSLAWERIVAPFAARRTRDRIYSKSPLEARANAAESRALSYSTVCEISHQGY